MTLHYTEAEIRCLLKSKAQEIVDVAERGTKIEIELLTESVSALSKCLPPPSMSMVQQSMSPLS